MADINPAWMEVWRNETNLENNLMSYVVIKANLIAKLSRRLKILSERLDTMSKRSVGPIFSLESTHVVILITRVIVDIIRVFVGEGSAELVQILPKERSIYQALERRSVKS